MQLEPGKVANFRRHLTLALCTLLHLATHAYGMLLVPLYLQMTADLHLSGVNRASLIVTIYGGCYFLGSYAAGVLADRLDRKLLLGLSVMGNAAAIGMMGLTHSYGMLIALSMAAGFCGTFFHPSAGALTTAHYPKNPGMAVGWMGIGSGLGFYLGPQFGGWRASTAHWQFDHVSNWQRPCIELGLIGAVVGVIFLLVAKEVDGKARGAGQPHPPLGRALARKIVRLGLVLGLRDFAGVATLSLASIYWLKAHHLPLETTGMLVGLLVLPSTLFNPLLVLVSPGRWRLPTLVGVLIVGGLAVPAVPWVGWKWGVVLLCIFETLQCGAYALSDAATMERVPAEVRGRVVGLFLTVAGLCGASGPWIMGKWTDVLGARAGDPHAYAGAFMVVGVAMWLATFCAPLFSRLGKPDASAVEPYMEISPAG